MIKKQKGGFAPSLLEPCTSRNIEERLIAVNNILMHSDSIRISPEDALMQIENLIPPNGFGRSIVWMNINITRNPVLRRMVDVRYRPSPNIGGKNKRRKTMKKNRKTKRRKSMKKKQRKTKRKGRR